MAEHGARVVIADLDPDAVARAAAAIPGTTGLALDVTDGTTSEAAFDRLAAKGAAPDVVVPNAGIPHLEAIDTVPAGRWEAVPRLTSPAPSSAHAAARHRGRAHHPPLPALRAARERAERGLLGLGVRDAGPPCRRWRPTCRPAAS